MPIKTALVVEGGAMRGIFSAGMLDQFILQQFYPFDYYCGVSAGASNLAAYLGGQYQRNYKVYTDYCQRPNFKSLRRFLQGGSLIDVDWLWDITERELPIGIERISEFGARFSVVATAANDLSAHYIVPQRDELFQALKCSGNMPFFVKSQVELHGRNWLDGGVSDSIPVEHAYNRGAKKIMVIRSQPREFMRKPYKAQALMPFFIDNKALLAKLKNRHLDYNHSVNFMRQPPADCQIVELCPPANIKLKQFTDNLSTLEQGYQAGVELAASAIAAWHEL